MGNTKTYYVEGELIKGTTLEEFKEEVSRWFRPTYCVADIVEATGGYLGPLGCATPEIVDQRGPYLVAAVHSYSLGGNDGPKGVAPLFAHMYMHSVDHDMDCVWVMEKDETGIREWTAPIEGWRVTG